MAKHTSASFLLLPASAAADEELEGAAHSEAR